MLQRIKICLLLSLLLSACITRDLERYIESGGIHQQYRFKNVLSKKSQKEVDLCFLFENKHDGTIRAAKVLMPSETGDELLHKQDAVLLEEGCGSDYVELEDFNLSRIKPDEICSVEFGVFGQSRSNDAITILACTPERDGRSSMRTIEAKLGFFDGKVAPSKKTYLYALYPVTIATDAALAVMYLVITSWGGIGLHAHGNNPP